MKLPRVGAEFLKRNFILIMVLWSALSTLATLATLSAQTAVAAGAGGANPGGQGGNLVPDKSRSGPGLTKIFEAGVEFLKAGDCKRAEKKFKRVLKTVPRNSEANYLRGVSLQCQDKHKQAVRYFKRSKRDDADFHRAYAELGLSYLVLERPDLAREQLKALERRKSICRSRCPRDLDKAFAKLRSAFDRIEGKPPQDPANIDQPNDQHSDQHGLLFDGVSEPQASYLASISLINREQFEAAIQELDRLAASLGPHPDVLNYLGYANRRLGRFDLAQNYYEQALAIDPLHRGANEYLGEMWVELGRGDEARERLSVLEEACPFGCVEYEDLRRLVELRIVAVH